MMVIKNLLFPKLCHRCHTPHKNFLCELCLLGFEIAAYKGGDVCLLFDTGADFLHKNRSDYQKIIQSFALIQLVKIRWKFSQIECEPELAHLKKFLEKSHPQDGHKILYLLHRRKDPILKEPIRKNSYILIV